MAKSKNINLFIDDSIENCLAIKIYIIDSPVNKCEESKYIESVYSWKEIYEKLNA